MCVATHDQIIQNSKFAISLKYLKKNEDWSVFFACRWAWKFPSNWYIERDLQRDTLSQNSQNRKLAMFLQYLAKHVRVMEIDIFHADKYQSFLQVDSNALIIKVFLMVILSLLIGMMKHSQITQSNKFAIIYTLSRKRSYGWSSFFACR